MKRSPAATPPEAKKAKGEAKASTPSRIEATEGTLLKGPEELPSSGKLGPYHLSTWQTSCPTVDEKGSNKVANPMGVKYPSMQFLNPDEMVKGHIIVNDEGKCPSLLKTGALDDGCVRGNAVRAIYWEPQEVKAAMVTCGGLCPGLNSIIRGLTNCLWHDYGVRKILGIQSGYNGLVNPGKFEPVELTPDYVREIHMKGGSVLKAGRGGFDAEKICNCLECLNIDLLFVIGGDGTQASAARRLRLPRRASCTLRRARPTHHPRISAPYH